MRLLQNGPANARESRQEGCLLHTASLATHRTATNLGGRPEEALREALHQKRQASEA